MESYNPDMVKILYRKDKIKQYNIIYKFNFSLSWTIRKPDDWNCKAFCTLKKIFFSEPFLDSVRYPPI
jgi:hypothetical protein